MTEEATRAKKDESIVEPDRAEIIDPMSFIVSNKTAGINYNCDFSNTRKQGDKQGFWRSMPPVQRPDVQEKFIAKMNEMRERGQIKGEGNSYFFTHEEGVRARELYEKEVLEGRVKPNKKAWNNRFAKFTNTTYEELEEKYAGIEVWSSKTRTSSQKKEEITQIDKSVDLLSEDAPVMPAEEEMEELVSQPSDEQLEDIEAQEEEVEEEESVAAASVLETTEEQEEVTGTVEDDDGEYVIEIPLNPSKERIDFTSETCLVRGTDGSRHEFHLVYVSHIDREMLLEEGSYELEGTLFHVRREMPASE